MVPQNSLKGGKPGFSVSQKHAIPEESFHCVNIHGIVIPAEKQIFPLPSKGLLIQVRVLD